MSHEVHRRNGDSIHSLNIEMCAYLLTTRLVTRSAASAAISIPLPKSFSAQTFQGILKYLLREMVVHGEAIEKPVFLKKRSSSKLSM